MTVILDPASKAQPPPSPPPAYSEQPEPHPSTSAPPAAAGYSPPTHPGYGPTPIAQQTHLLPYYDPRSPWAQAEAASRARWRFIGAVLWAMGLFALLSFLFGWEVEQAMRAHGASS